MARYTPPTTTTFSLQNKHTLFFILQNIAARAKRCISKHDFAAVLVIFPILKQLLALKPDFERTVEECDLNVRLKFDSILNMLHSTVSRIERNKTNRFIDCFLL